MRVGVLGVDIDRTAHRAMMSVRSPVRVVATPRARVRAAATGHRTRARAPRRASADDLDDVARLQARAFYVNVLGANRPWTIADDVLRVAFEVDVRRTLRRKHAMGSRGRFAALVMDDARGALAGACEVAIMRDADVLEAIGRRRGFERVVGDGEYAYVSCAAVREEARGRGIGTALVRASEATARAWGCRCVALHVYESNVGARRVYERAGYEVCDRPRRTWSETLRNGQKLLMVRAV